MILYILTSNRVENHAPDISTSGVFLFIRKFLLKQHALGTKNVDCDILYSMNDGREKYMKLSNGSEVKVRRYQDQDAETIVNLIRRNFLEVNVKDYGEEAMKALAQHHDVNWMRKDITDWKNLMLRKV